MSNSSAKYVRNRGWLYLKDRAGTKLALKRALGSLPLRDWTARRPNLNRLERAKMSNLSWTLLKSSGHMVFGGPFATMRLAEHLDLASDPKFVVGSYEEEIHEVINEVICMAPAHIIDIGSAFGYYAVGFALKIATTTVTAFEAVEDQHWEQLQELASLNNVSGKIVQRGRCTVDKLAQICTPKSFILCDCEGGEIDILQPDAISALSSCKILVELHEFHVANLVATLVRRFRDSHQIRIIQEQGRHPSRYRILKRLPKRWRSLAIEEVKWIPGNPSPIATSLRFMLLDPKH